MTGSRAWGLQDRVVAGAGPDGERRAEVAVIEILGRDPQALPVREPAGEGAPGGGQVLDPLAEIPASLKTRCGARSNSESFSRRRAT
jgi:hypothetical protein